MTWYCDYLTQFGRSLSHPGHTHSTTSLTGSVTTPGGPSIPSSLHNMPGSQGGNLSSQSARWKALQVLKYCNKNLLGFYSEMFLITNKFLKLHQGLQILVMGGVTMTSVSQILESFWNIWSQVSQRKKPFSDFPARGPGMYTLSWGIHEVAVAVRWPGKLKSMMAVIE